VVGGAPGQQISGQSPPGKLVILGVRDLVVASLCDDALVEAQEVNVLIGNLGLAVQNSSAARVSMRAGQLWQYERAPSLLVVLGQRVEELVVFLGALDGRFGRFARRHGAVRALITGQTGADRGAPVKVKAPRSRSSSWIRRRACRDDEHQNAVPLSRRAGARTAWAARDDRRCLPSFSTRFSTPPSPTAHNWKTVAMPMCLLTYQSQSASNRFHPSQTNLQPYTDQHAFSPARQALQHPRRPS
jgi:hypothetical protein